VPKRAGHLKLNLLNGNMTQKTTRKELKDVQIENMVRLLVDEEIERDESYI